MSNKKLYTIHAEEQGWDDDFVKEVAGLFVQHVPKMSYDLVKSCGSKNWQQVYFFAHKMKASLDLLEVEDMKDTIRHLEQLAKNQQNIEEIPNLVEYVNRMVLDCSEQLKQDFNL